MQGGEHRRPQRLVFALQGRELDALLAVERAGFVEHDRNEVAVGPEQHLEMGLHQAAQLRLGRLLGGGRQRGALARQGGVHAFLHDGKQQRVLAFEMVEGRAALHAGGGRNVARGGGGKALAAKQGSCGTQQGGAAVAVVAL